MLKLIAILAAAIPIILFLRTMFFGRSKVLSEAASNLRKQVDYMAWGILVIIGCGIAYALVSLIYSMRI